MILKCYETYSWSRGLILYQKFETAFGEKMNLTEKQQILLRMLPAVDYILELSKTDSFLTMSRNLFWSAPSDLLWSVFG